MDLLSCAPVILNMLAISERLLFSLKKHFSSWQYRVAASTRVGAFLLYFANPVEFGSGNPIDLQKIVISFFPASVLGSVGLGGGTANGDAQPSGSTRWTVSGTATARITKNCSGVTNPVRSEMPLAA